MIDPARTVLFIPDNLRRFKLDLFNRIGKQIERRGGRIIRGDIKALAALPDDILPITGCMPELTELLAEWRQRGRERISWDRGYFRRVFATWLPRGENGGFYRWHRGSYQLREIRECPDNRWKSLKIPMEPWQKNGRHIVVLAPTPTYEKFHKIEDWTDKTLRLLAKTTERQIVIRHKDSSRPLQWDLKGAHCAVANGSIAAVESVICGCPIFDNPESAAALAGLTDLSQIERPIYPDRQPWVNALSYSQFNEAELVDGTLWRLLT